MKESILPADDPNCAGYARVLIELDSHGPMKVVRELTPAVIVNGIRCLHGTDLVLAHVKCGLGVQCQLAVARQAFLNWQTKVVLAVRASTRACSVWSIRMAIRFMSWCRVGVTSTQAKDEPRQVHGHLQRFLAPHGHISFPAPLTSTAHLCRFIKLTVPFSGNGPRGATSVPRSSRSNSGKLARAGSFRSSRRTAAPNAPLNKEYLIRPSRSHDTKARSASSIARLNHSRSLVWRNRLRRA